MKLLAQTFFLTASWFANQNSALAAAEKVPAQVGEASGHMLKPAEGGFNESQLKDLKVPPGFRVSVFAKDLKNPRMMVVDSDGTVYVSRPKEGDILALKDTNGDGVSDQQRTVVQGQDRPHGLVLKSGKLYFFALKKIFKIDATVDAKTASAKPELVVEGLPDAGQHENRSMALGPDGLLYVAIASTCNSCDDANSENATLLTFKLDGTSKKVFARGLRDTIGFDWHPVSKELWGFDHGVDWRGDDLPHEELNHLVSGKNYGWPFCYEDKKPDLNLVDNPPKSTKEKFCKTTEAPALLYQAHSAPIAMKFYTGKQFPAEFANSAFVAMHGSWNRKPPSGYKVVRVVFDGKNPKTTEDFLSGFLSADGKSVFGRPAGIAIDNDGSLLVSDDSGGVIYRVSYAK